MRANVDKSTEVGRTVATDFSGALVSAGLLEIDPQTDKRLDYFEVARKLEALRAKYEGGRADRAHHRLREGDRRHRRRRARRGHVLRRGVRSSRWC